MKQFAAGKEREIIQLHVGQAGVQMASACWELYCLEHGIYPDGQFCDCSLNEDCSAFFSCDRSGQCVPRVLLVDMEPSVVDEIRIGTYRDLFHPSSLLTGCEDAASNFGRGHYRLGQTMIEPAMDRLRKLCEHCSSLQGFMMFHSVGGGTGAGLGTLLLERLGEDFGKASRMEFDIFPSPKISPVIVEPYNAILASHVAMEHSDCTFVLDNEALYDVCDRSLSVREPTYTNLNRLVAQAVSCVTASLRFSGAINVDLLEFQTNLVPFPRIHYPLVTYAPLAPASTARHEQPTTAQLTYECFEPGSQLVKCDPRAGRYMSCCLLYRGNIAPIEINRALLEMRSNRSIQFVDWCPTGFKIGINFQPPIAVPGADLARSDLACCMLANNTAIRTAWTRVADKFQRMYDRKAFFYHYLSEGLEEQDLTEAIENIRTLIKDYEEIEK
ncbi:tubulin alpha chain-like isoform X1 [Anopheles merus]|uniref:tubulin alpha chain-like isoform X1 n=1 Tax=Anopheles merus TaxID=30066 RepID=UPI001BE4924C|nr:tubulin alpha chain-like isoform X1 [Anopheles merus]